MIEEVTIESVQDWANLASQVWQEEPSYLVKEFREGLFPNEFLYQKDGKCIAFLSLSIRYDYVEGAKSSPVAYLEGIYVMEEYQQQHIARTLLEYAKKWARKQGLHQLASDCEWNNVASQVFHQKLGFTEVSRSVHYMLNFTEEEEDVR